MTTPPVSKHLVLTVHGIRTYGLWQRRLGQLLMNAHGHADLAKELEISHYKYGVFTLLAFVVPFLRNLAVRKFKQNLEAILDGKEFDRIDIVAHSFGAYLAVEALSQLSEDKNKRARIHTLLLASGVISPERSLSQLIGRDGSVGRIINDCGIRDDVLLLTLLVLGVGMGGRLGLHGFEGRSLVNRYFDFRHGGYFEASDWGDADAFMKRCWLPLLLNNADVELHDARAARPSLPDRFWRTLGENSAPATLSIYTALSGLLIGTLAYLWLAAEASKRDAEWQRDQVLITQSRFLADLGEQLASAGDAVSGMLIALEALPDSEAGVVRPYVSHAEVSLYSALHRRREAHVLAGSRYVVVSATFNPVSGQLALACSDNMVRILETKTFQLIKELDHLESADPKEQNNSPRRVLGDVSFSPDGLILMSSSWNGKVRFWDTITWSAVAAMDGFQSRGIDAPAYTRTKRVLLLKDNEVYVYDVAQRKWISKVSWPGVASRVARLSPDGKWIVTAASDQPITVWRAENGEQVASFPGTKKKSTYLMSFDPSGLFAVTLGDTGTPQLWDAQTWRPIADLLGSQHQIKEAIFSPDGSRVLTLHLFDRIARIWDGKTGVLLSEVEEHPEYVGGGSFSPDGSKIATTSDTAIRVFDAHDGRLLLVLRGHSIPATFARFVNNGREILTASSDYTVRLWDATTGEQKSVFKGHDASLETTWYGEKSLSPDGAWLLTLSQWDKSARLWDVELAAESRVLRGHKHRVASVAFSPNGTIVATTSLENVVRLFDPRTGRHSRDLITGASVDHALFSTDGEQLLTISGGGTVEVFSLLSGQSIKTYGGQSEYISKIAFSPKGERVATSSVDGAVRIWDAKTGALLLHFIGHPTKEAGQSSWVTSVSFSPDGNRLVARFS